MSLSATRYDMISPVAARVILGNVRGLLRGRVRNRTNWSLVMDVFGVGSTSAHELCHLWAIDPEGMEAKEVNRG